MLLTDEAIMNALITTIINKAIKCKFCRERVYILNKREFYVRCSWKFCRKEYSILSGTVFEHSKISLLQKLRILELWSINLKTHEISAISGISKRSVSTILASMKKKMVETYYSKFSRIGCEKVIVEIDESKFGHRKYNKGRLVDDVWVLGMVERTIERRIFLTEVKQRNFLTLKNEINKHVETNSIIYTDLWKGYTRINYQHATVNHKKNFVDPITRVHTNTIEGNWRAVKSKTPNRCKTKDLVKPYLVRFMIKRNETGNFLENLIKYTF